MNAEGRRFKFRHAQRLSRPAEFARVKSEGASHRGKWMTLGVLAAEGDSCARFSFVTSRRAGEAVVRNKLRRRFREIVRKRQHEIAPGVWVVTIARPAAANAPFAALELEWLRLAERASILRP